METKSSLELLRLEYQPELPPLLQKIEQLQAVYSENEMKVPDEIKRFFPQTANQKLISFQVSKNLQERKALNVGVVFSGGQAAGGHNVIWGLSEALLKLNPESTLLGFLNGPKGIITNKFIKLTPQLIDPYRNQGGFDLIGSGRDKIETPEQFQAAENTVNTHKLDGILIIGGDDSHTNVALLAEYFAAKKIPCSVVGVPKTIDGDLRNKYVETSFGFDTACKVYSEIIGNIARDSLSAKKYFFFIKLMGRSASHITLECALQTHPQMALIGEEVEFHKKTLKNLTQEITDLICQRAEKGKNYGIILIPEGIIEFIPEVKLLIADLNRCLASDPSLIKKLEGIASKRNRISYLTKYISKESSYCLEMLPELIQDQLLLERDPHGNVQVSRIETERLFVELVNRELEIRKKINKISVKFNPQPIFCGYEGRAAFPSNFDCRYCYALGHIAALLIDAKASGYMGTIQNLAQPIENWKITGVPIIPLMRFEQRHGEQKPVVQKVLVDLNSYAFQQFKKVRSEWALEDDYCYPGPIQFFGPSEISNNTLISFADNL